jgi:hypothetical protein
MILRTTEPLQCDFIEVRCEASSAVLASKQSSGADLRINGNAA